MVVLMDMGKKLGEKALLEWKTKAKKKQPIAQKGITLSGPTIRGKKYPKGTVVTNDPAQVSS